MSEHNILKLSGLPDKKRLTTGQVAICCGVSQQTVIRWCQNDQVKNHKIPGSKHRRLFAADVRNFLDESGMPYD